jgi:hypothetical protein
MASHLNPALSTSFQLPPTIHPVHALQLQQTADRLWLTLLNQPSQPLDWRAQHRFYLELQRPGWTRLRLRFRHLRILSTRAIEADFVFAASFGLHRNWQVRLLRPIRLLTQSSRED